MSVRLRILNTILRGFVKPGLARTKDPLSMRRKLARSTSLLLPSPPSEAVFETCILEAPKRPESAGPLTATRCEFETRRPADNENCAILFLHGGAYMVGSPETHRSLIWPLARATGAPIVAVDYRLAPEHLFPAAFEDACDAFDALLAKLGPRARIALVGDSAGGGLALALAAHLSARPADQQPVAVAAFSPFADLTLSGRSIVSNARRDVMLPTHRMREAVDAYLNGADPSDPRASPLFAEWPSPPPPTIIQASHSEALRDDASRMADVLRAAGGDVRLELWRRTPHAWQFFAPWVPEAARALESVGVFLSAHLHASDGEG